MLPDVTGLPILANACIVVACIIVIAFGANWVVDGAAGLASRLGISEIIIGLTVVSLGTSAPEFAVTLIAAFNGQGDISVGNIVGSNIFNLGFILGGCALMHPLAVHPVLLRRDGAVLMTTTVLLVGLLCWDLEMGRGDGLLLLFCLVAYLRRLYQDRDLDLEEGDDDEVTKGLSLGAEFGYLLAGFLAIVLGSEMLVASATTIARHYGISDWVIAVTIVAAGTSAPEMATSFVAALKGKDSISVGNLIGSDIFNLLGVLGLAGTIHPVAVDPKARGSLAALVFMVGLALWLARRDHSLGRREGAILVAVALARWGFDLYSRI